MFSRALANAGGRRVAAWQGAKLWAGAAPVVAKATRGNAATYSTHISSGASLNTAHRAQAWPLGSGPRVASVAGSGAQGLHTSAAPRGLDEFFPRGTPEETSQSGRAWLARDVRNKSNIELHQLWYILLKERNMLLTVRQEAKVCLQPFPGPERLRKVRKSMKAVKIVIAERKQVAERAAEADPETWEQLRENIDVETGIRAQIGSEKKGRVRRAAPSLEAEQDMSEKEYLQLLGISRPGKAVPGQPQRPMRKAERTEFRRNLQAARQAIVAAKHQAIEDELTALTDDAIEPIVRDAEDELTDGWALEELSHRHYFSLTEARRRGMETIYAPREIAHDRKAKSIARLQHGIKDKTRGDRIKQRDNLI